MTAEEEVRNILDEAISASVTACTPGISWGKLMTIIQMQRPLVDDYISQRRKVQPVREVNIGDSVNPFRAEIVKLICALQLTGRFTDTNTASREVTRTNNKVVDPYEVSLQDNCHQSGCEITVSKKCKNSKWVEKHFGKGNKMHNESEEKRLLNTYNDAAVGQTCGPFSFTFNVNKDELSKSHKSDQLNEPNIDTTNYRNDYNSYLIARYESEYGDVNLSSTKDGEFTEVHDEDEKAQYAEHNMFELKKSSTNDLCKHDEDKEAQYAEHDMYELKKSSTDDLCIRDEDKTAQYAEHSMYELKKSSTDDLCIRDEDKAAQYAEHDMYELKKSSTDDLCIHDEGKESHYAEHDMYELKKSSTDDLCVHDEDREAQYAEHDMYELKKTSTDDLCMYPKIKSENHIASSSLYDNTSHKLDNGIHCEQTLGQSVLKVSPQYHPKKCETEDEQFLGTNLFPTGICANSSSEHLAQMSHKNARDYSHDKKQTDEQNKSLGEVTDTRSVCELYRMKEKSHCYTQIDNSLNNKTLMNNDELHLHPVAGSPSQHVLDERTYVAKDIFKKYSSPPGNTAEYLFQNFIQPEDENNIHLLLEHNLSSGHNSPHYRSPDEINAVLDYTLKDTLGNQRRRELEENKMDKNKETGINILEHSSQIAKNSLVSSNDQKETVLSVGRKEVLQEFQQVNEFQQHLNNTTGSTITAGSNSISTSYVNKADYECQNVNSDNLFSNKKVYWSSVGLIIEDLIDSNVLPVAGHSDVTLGEPQDSKVDKKSVTLYDDESTRDQIIDFENTNYSRPEISNETEDSSFITEPDVEGSAGLAEKDRSFCGKPLSEDTSAKSENTKKSQQKRSFFKSLQRFFHISRKH